MISLYKTIIVVWSEQPMPNDLTKIAYEANEGNAFCSTFKGVLVLDPKADQDWDGTEFFDIPDMD